MVSYISSSPKAKPVNTRQSEILESLMYVVLRSVNTQFPAFSRRLIDALLLASQQGSDANQTNFCFHASTLLKNNESGLARELQKQLEQGLKRENTEIEHGFKHELAKNEGALSLVPFEEMDHKVLLSGISRPFELKYADQLVALNIRLAFLLERDEVPIARNPFRPEVFITALVQAWHTFDTNVETRDFILPFFHPQCFLDLGLVFQALNESLMGRGILPGSVDSYRIKKTDGKPSGGTGTIDSAQLKQQVQQWLETESSAQNLSNQHAGLAPNAGQLWGFLSQLQARIAASSTAGDTGKGTKNVVYLQKIKQMAPKGSLSQVDEKAIDLLTRVFESAFLDQAIPQEIKSLVGLLQVPVLNEALKNKDFFYQETHPARRLIELLTQLSLGWEAGPNQQDPLFLAMQRNVALLQNKSAQQGNLFTEVVAELENQLKQEQQAMEQAISAPIAEALKQEKTQQLLKISKQEVAMRVGTGEVVAFVETFLEDKWVSVLTLAYGVQEDKPEVAKSAIKTMDDLIWSVKPKITASQRKEFIAKLPGLLAMLNKWLNVIQWDDADRLQFFAELAETHASIVRAPLVLSPERQMEIALEVAQNAAQRRLARQANAQPEPPPDEMAITVEELQRGMWLEFTGEYARYKKVKLVWISPMRSLYIFSTNGRNESFSLSDVQLADEFRAARAQVLRLGGSDGKNDFVSHALLRAVNG